MTPSGIELITFRLEAPCLNQLRYGVHKGFWLQNLMEKDHVEDLGINGRISFKLMVPCIVFHC